MSKIIVAVALRLTLSACGHRDNKNVATAKNVVDAAKAMTMIGQSRADVQKQLGNPHYGDDLEWHYYSTDPASGRELTCFIYLRPDTGIVRDVNCR